MVRITTELHRKLVFAMLERHVPSLQDLLTRLIEDWVAEGEIAGSGYRSLQDMVRELHLKWSTDPGSVAPSWAQHFEEMERSAGVIAMTKQKSPEIQSVSVNPDLTVACERAVSEAPKSASVSLVGDSATANWMEILRRILASGHSVAINAITHNLNAFYELAVRPKGINNGSSETVHPPAAKEKQGTKTSTRHKKRKAS
jgi:hypothetical protein